ncbi:MAG: acyl-CoA thioesterase [Actinomycetota bacterium]|jgi:acyl-CoA thioesterase|nr:acyl-CoA thioesterase [Actinomycetota bacterium]
MGDLALDTKVTGSVGRYSARLSRDWEIWGPNGGYIAAIALRAAGEHSRFGRPVSIAGHFLGVAGFDEVILEVKTLRLTKRAESMRVTMTQQKAPIFEALVWTCAPMEGLEHELALSPATFEPESVPSTAERMAESGVELGYKFWSNFDERSETWLAADEWLERTPSYPSFERFYRFLPTSTFDDLWVDACRSLILIDTLGWPAVCQLHVDSGYVAPSIDITCSFHRARIEEPWLFAQATSVSANAGIIGCEGKVWARDGALLAMGTSQLLCRPMPSPAEP